MYVCPKHGVLDTEWCNPCGTILVCDCDDDGTSTRIKDIRYDCDNGERTVTIYIYHCATCGQVNGVHLS